MEFPVRCFTCGKVIGDLYETYKNLIKEKSVEAALDELGIERYCCRRMFISHVEMIESIAKYPRY
jgi:DNA-directed RNA polymerase subunit N